MVSWCSGYHVCFTRRRSRVRASLEPPFFGRKIISCCKLPGDKTEKKIAGTFIFSYVTYMFTASLAS